MVLNAMQFPYTLKKDIKFTIYFTVPKEETNYREVLLTGTEYIGLCKQSTYLPACVGTASLRTKAVVLTNIVGARKSIP